MGRAQIIKAKVPVTGGETLIGYRAYEEDPFDEGTYLDGNLIAPPYPITPLLQMVEYSTILQQCIDAYKRNIPGFGTQLIYIDDTVTKLSETPEMVQEWDMVTNWIEYFNFDKSFKDVWEHAIEHRERCGNGYIEIIRDGANRVVGGENVDPEYMRVSKVTDPVVVEYETPAGSVKRRKKFRKYAQKMSAGNIVWFKEFGDPRFMDSRTGEFTSLHNGDEEATEILHLKIGDKAYGIPRWIGHLVHMYGARNAEELNYNYFKNGRHTPLAVVVSNGMLTEESVEKLQDYADGVRGVDNSHGFLLLEAEGLDEGTSDPMEEKKTGVKVELQPLAEMLQQDGLFLDYDEKSSKKVQSVFRLADLYVGKNQDFNRATADTARTVTEEQVFEPERQSLEFIINKQLLREYELKHVKVIFRSPAISDTEEKVAMLTALNAINAVAPNDVRDELGKILGKELEPFPQEEANLPTAIANMLKAAENAQAHLTARVNQERTRENIEKAVETQEFINLLKDIRDEVSDYNAVIEKVRNYSETSGTDTKG